MTHLTQEEFDAVSVAIDELVDQDDPDETLVAERAAAERAYFKIRDWFLDRPS